jgi:hypothetical protein
MLVEKRLNRRSAADYVMDRYGFRLSARTLEDAPIPYIVVNGQAIYKIADLDQYAQNKINSASRRMGRGSWGAQNAAA